MSIPSFVILLFFLRMFGLLAFNPLAKDILESYPGNSFNHIGLLISSYGITQAFLQYPLAVFSDYIGRLKVIRYGLVFFFISTFVGYYIEDPFILILCRVIQGSCAIGSTSLALLADFANGSDFQKYYYRIGLAIFLSIVGSYLFASFLSSIKWPRGVFILMSITSLFLFFISFTVKAPALAGINYQTLARRFFIPEFTTPLVLLSIFSFFIHFLQTFSMALISKFYEGTVSYLYTNALFLSLIICLFPLARRNFLLSMNWTLYIIFGAFIVQKLIFDEYNFMFFSVLSFSLCLILEACIPSLLSKFLNDNNRGMSMGFNSTCQYFGFAFGGVVADFIATDKWFYYSHAALYFLIACMCVMTRELLCREECSSH